MVARRNTRLVAALVAAVAFAAVLAGPASSSQLIDRNAQGVRLAVNTKGEALLTYRVGGRLRHVLASHMDVNAIDLSGADGDAAELERAAAGNVKRVVRGEADAQSPYEAASFLELKTVWHPIGA